VAVAIAEDRLRMTSTIAVVVHRVATALAATSTVAALLHRHLATTTIRAMTVTAHLRLAAVLLWTTILRLPVVATKTIATARLLHLAATAQVPSLT